MQTVKITKELYEKLLRPLAEKGNKGTNGTLSVIAGSECYRGAACLAVGGAMKTGVGIVRLMSVEKAVECTAYRHPSATFLPIKSDGEGMIEFSDAFSKLQTVSEKSTAMLFGCGLGQGNGCMRLLREVISIELPLVIDADGLNLLSRNPSLLNRRTAPTVITPHIGEMSRLCGKSIPEIKNDRIGCALGFAKEHGVTVILKDDVTFIATPDGDVFGSSLGNEGLAKGGSGDVLAGFISGFLAQHYSAVDAAILGCALHGLKAQACASKYGVREMRPEQLIE